MKRTLLAIASSAISICACGEIARSPATQKPPQMQPVDPAVPVPVAVPQSVVPVDLVPSSQGIAPELGGGPLFSNAGAFNLGATTPGSATFTAAPVIDYLGNAPPAALGSGGWSSIVAGGSTFDESMAESLAGVLPDGRGTDYLLLTAYTEEIDPASGATIGTVMHAIVLASDFSPGGSVGFDGIDRLAIFARGDISLPEPDLAAAAVTGTITFSSGGLAAGDLITATLTGDFGEFTWSSPPPPTGGTLSPGSYQLHYDPLPNVFCDGSLAGQEAQFAAITAASIGFSDGSVTVANGAIAGSFEISGAPIASGYGVATLTLEAFPDAPPGVVGAQTIGSGSGPAGTIFAGTYLVLDGSSATATEALGWAGAGYLTAAQDGFCSVDFLVELGP